MTYTCATEGCGEPIYWGTYTPVARWRHERSDNLTCVVLGIWLAHPAGGTNTTPPEELERDVKKVTMTDIVRASVYGNRDIRDILARYADQAVEEAAAGLKVKLDNLGQELSDYNRANDQLTRRLVDAKAEVADLRDQLDRALVPRFRMGDKVSMGPGRKGTVEFISEISYIISDGSGVEMTFHESSLSPLPEKCQHTTGWGTGWGQPIIEWYREAGIGTSMDESTTTHCFKCGESLTSGEGE